MVEDTKEWRVFVPSDPSIDPENEAVVEWEFANGIREIGVFESARRQIRFDEDNPRIPKQLPTSEGQRWRYRPRD
jgi:hypothetical protein